MGFRVVIAQAGKGNTQQNYLMFGPDWVCLNAGTLHGLPISQIKGGRRFEKSVHITC